jgi:carbon monoxide dehydrogenase subunit G
MHFTGSYLLNATPQIIWPHIFNPEMLIKLIPGCQSVVQVSPDEYKTVIDIGLPAVVGRYDAAVKLVDYQEPFSCSFEGLVESNAGHISGTASFLLQEVNQDKTEIQYKADAIISGPLGKLKGRFIQGVAQTLINQGLSHLNRELTLNSEKKQNAYSGSDCDNWT